MKISSGYLLKTIAGKNIVISVNNDLDFNGMVTLNDTGVFLWNLLKNETTKAEMLKAVLQEYDVSAEEAANDIDAFVTKLSASNILEGEIC